MFFAGHFLNKVRLQDLGPIFRDHPYIKINYVSIFLTKIVEPFSHGFTSCFGAKKDDIKHRGSG